MNVFDLSLDFEMTPENEKAIKELLKTKGLVHYAFTKENGEKYDLVEYEDYQKLEKVIKEAIEFIKDHIFQVGGDKDFEYLLKILERTDK